MRRMWEALGLLIVLVIAVQIAIASLTPYLPVLGLVLLVIITGILIRILWLKRKFW